MTSTYIQKKMGSLTVKKQTRFENPLTNNLFNTVYTVSSSHSMSLVTKRGNAGVSLTTDSPSVLLRLSSGTKQ